MVLFKRPNKFSYMGGVIKQGCVWALSLCFRWWVVFNNFLTCSTENFVTHFKLSVAYFNSCYTPNISVALIYIITMNGDQKTSPCLWLCYIHSRHCIIQIRYIFTSSVVWSVILWWYNDYEGYAYQFFCISSSGWFALLDVCWGSQTQSYMLCMGPVGRQLIKLHWLPQFIRL